MVNCMSKNIDDCNKVKGCWCCKYHKEVLDTKSSTNKKGDEKDGKK